VHSSAQWSPQPKRQIDRFSFFAQLTAESPYTLQWAPLSLKIALSHGGCGPHLRHDSLGPSESTTHFSENVLRSHFRNVMFTVHSSKKGQIGIIRPLPVLTMYVDAVYCYWMSVCPFCQLRHKATPTIIIRYVVTSIPWNRIWRVGEFMVGFRYGLYWPREWLWIDSQW